MPYSFGARVNADRSLTKVEMKGRVKADRTVEASDNGHPVDTTPPPPVRGVPYWKHPYRRDTSYWNMTIRDGATYHSTSDLGTISFQRAKDASGAYLKNADGTPRYIGTVINVDYWCQAVWYPKTTDPTTTIRAVGGGTTYATINLPPDWKIPGPAAPNERDAWVTIVTPDGKSAIDCYKTTPVYSGTTLQYFTVTRPPMRSDLLGDGHVMDTQGLYNPTPTATRGMRASTLSYMGGSIRKWEVLEKRIDHALHVALPDGSLKSGFIYPARAQDSNGATAYIGDAPMGSRFALPPSMDIAQMGLKSAEGLALARAMQMYGCILGDRSGTCSLTAERPNESHSDFQTHKDALIRMSNDWKIIARNVVRVTGFSATAPAGPGNIRPEWGEVPDGVVAPVY